MEAHWAATARSRSAIHRIPEAECISARQKRSALFAKTCRSMPWIPFAIKEQHRIWLKVPTTAGLSRLHLYQPARIRHRGRQCDSFRCRCDPAGQDRHLDQFAAPAWSTRSIVAGACSSVFDERYISGGSSSGSAVAVAAGLVSFSLGTDTAGSGRVPAAFNGIVGLKPTRGALSTKGVVPACRTLDCVSIFALNCADAAKVFDAAQGFDFADPYSRPTGQRKSWPEKSFRFGVPSDEWLRFFGDESSGAAFSEAVRLMESLGGIRTPVDYSPFNEAALLLYSGPWVAERLAAIREFLAAHPDALHPVTARIIKGAANLTATDTFEAFYKLAAIRRATEPAWERMDFMLLPTAGTHYTHAEVEAEPIAANTNLGYYTNFVNLLDLTAVAIPAGSRANGMPFGVTLIGPAWSEEAY